MYARQTFHHWATSPALKFFTEWSLLFLFASAKVDIIKNKRASMHSVMSKTNSTWTLCPSRFPISGDCVSYFFGHCDKISEIKNFKEGKIYLTHGFRDFSLDGSIVSRLWQSSPSWQGVCGGWMLLDLRQPRSKREKEWDRDKTYPSSHAHVTHFLHLIPPLNRHLGFQWIFHWRV
jgi:hypothetical protein